jgi:hypothetical protein
MYCFVSAMSQSSSDPTIRFYGASILTYLPNHVFLLTFRPAHLWPILGAKQRYATDEEVEERVEEPGAKKSRVSRLDAWMVAKGAGLALFSMFLPDTSKVVTANIANTNPLARRSRRDRQSTWTARRSGRRRRDGDNHSPSCRS